MALFVSHTTSWGGGGNSKIPGHLWFVSEELSLISGHFCPCNVSNQLQPGTLLCMPI